MLRPPHPILEPDTAKKVLTEKRVELIRTIKGEEIISIEELSEKVDRKIGRKKKPELTHKNILTSPITLAEHPEEEMVKGGKRG